MPRKLKIRLFSFMLLGWALLLLGDRVDELRVYQGASIAVYAIAIGSIVLLTGYSGQISLGHGALMAVGGYAAAVASVEFGIPFWAGFILAALISGIFGGLLGIAAARLSGPYLAGTTLALAVGLPSLANQFPILGGEQGLYFDIGMPPQQLGESFTQYKWFYWIAALVALIVFFLLSNLLSSRYGRTWRGIGSNETAVALSGSNPQRLKILAFTLSSALAGLSGALLVMTISTASPSAFPLALSLSVVTGAVIAGVSSLKGVIFGSVILVAIPEIADAISHRVGDTLRISSTLPGLLISILLVFAVLVTPNGPGENLRHLIHKRKSHK
jgi:branched-chain amino acid transport system permease protein